MERRLTAILAADVVGYSRLIGVNESGTLAALARRGIERAENELTLHPDNPRPAYLGAAALVKLGQNDRAKEWIARALSIDPDDTLTQYNAACVYSLVGESDHAFDLLERLLPHANRETKAWIKHDSDLDSLRDHPRYQKVLELVGK